jgi:hypothetical protein
MRIFERRRAVWDCVEPYGMAKLSRPGLRRRIRLTSEYVSASVFSGGWVFGYASRSPVLPKPIRNGKRCIKKLQALMEDETVDLWATDEVHFQQHGSRCQMWIPPGNRQVQWRDFLCVHEKPSPDQHPNRAESGRNHRQREISSFPTAQGVYSPELNPIERVWKLTRRHCWHNRYFSDLDKVIGAVEATFDPWTVRNETLRRLCAIT